MFDVDAMIQAADLESMLTEMGLEPQRRQNKNGFELYINCFNPKPWEAEKDDKISSLRV